MQALSDLPVQLIGSGNHKRQYTFMDDIVPHIATAPFVAESGTVVNLGADEITSARDVVDAVADITGRELATQPAPRAVGVHHAQVCHLAVEVKILERSSTLCFQVHAEQSAQFE
jgi:nucleoside-diphosphate-sugar epimerase